MKTFKSLNKTFWLLMALSASVAVFNSCDDDKEPGGGNLTTDEGVWINGVKWATRNVGTSKRFVNNSENYGQYYTFEQAQAACPVGWRLPTLAELESLLDTEKVEQKWIAEKNGKEFKDKATGNTLFLPAAGHRYNGTLYFVGENGSYWSSTPYSDYTMCNLHFSSNVTDTCYFYYSGSRFSVRCVAK